MTLLTPLINTPSLTVMASASYAVQSYRTLDPLLPRSQMPVPALVGLLRTPEQEPLRSILRPHGNLREAARWLHRHARHNLSSSDVPAQLTSLMGRQGDALSASNMGMQYFYGLAGFCWQSGPVITQSFAMSYQDAEPSTFISALQTLAQVRSLSDATHDAWVDQQWEKLYASLSTYDIHKGPKHRDYLMRRLATTLAGEFDRKPGNLKFAFRLLADNKQWPDKAQRRHFLRALAQGIAQAKLKGASHHFSDLLGMVIATPPLLANDGLEAIVTGFVDAIEDAARFGLIQDYETLPLLEKLRALVLKQCDPDGGTAKTLRSCLQNAASSLGLGRDFIW